MIYKNIGIKRLKPTSANRRDSTPVLQLRIHFSDILHLYAGASELFSVFSERIFRKNIEKSK